MPSIIRFTDIELEALLDDLESDRVERKQAFNRDTAKKVRQAVCAFANDLPGHKRAGVLFIGARDDGTAASTTISDNLLRNLADIKTDGKILPLPAMTVEKRQLKGAQMAVLTVMPSDMPPVKHDGRIWVRTGPRRALASAQEERMLNEKRRYHSSLPFDIHPVPTATLTDLSRRIFESEYLPAAFAPDVLEANDRTYAERLASCRLIASPEDTTPTVLGLLSLGINPQDFLPGAYIQFLRIDGTELADPVIDESGVRGTLVDIVRRTEEKLAAHNRVAIDIRSGPTQVDKRPYPPAALQQILYNAILHRSYETTNAPVRIHWFNDRIEMLSPGGPYGNVTEANFGEPGITDYRNPNVGEVLKTFGLVQRFGRGIATARSELKKNANPALEFEVDRGHVLCTIRQAQ